MIFNPVALGTQLQKKFALPELAGWTPPGELFEAIRLPFHRIGLSLDEMLLYMGIVQIGLQAEWIEATQAQLRIVTGLESALSAANGPRRHRISAEARGMLLPGVTPTRGTVRAITAKYGDALEGVEPDHDFIRIFAAAVALYREAGAQVVVYVVPINYEHFDKMGVWNGAGMRKTVDSLRRAVETAGGTVVDLHQLIPDVGFMDAAGHHTFAPPYHGPDLIARELAPIVISLIDDSRKRGR
jgi:hypothetical protein